MACTPFVTPPVGQFINNTQGAWSNTDQASGDRSVSYSGGTVTIDGPNGSTFVAPAGMQVVRHKFFGSGNFLAILVSETGSGSIQHWMSIVDFTAPTIQRNPVLNVLSQSSMSLPWLQHSVGTGSACLIGAPTPSGVSGLSVLRSDTGAVICPGPPPLNASLSISGEATATAVQIKHGGSIIAGPCPFPAGSLDVQPNSQSFGTVSVGGCATTPTTRQFTLRNSGDDCLRISGVGPSGPFSVTGQSMAFPADLAPTETMTVTVTFAPTTTGAFNNVSLPVTRLPAAGESTLICSGQAQQAQPAVSVMPGTVSFGAVPVGSSETGSVTIRNTGGVPIDVQVEGSSSGAFGWPAVGPTTLSCGQETTVAVTFTPPSQGLHADTLVVQSPSTGNRSVSLEGVGCIASATIDPPPAPFPGFGQVRQGYRMPRFVTVRNTGDGTLTFSARITGPDAASFGLMRASQSITDVVATRTYSVEPVQRCGPGATGDGAEEISVVFFANMTPPYTATATLTIDSHNDTAAPGSFVYTLTAQVIAANVVDVVAVFDRSGSMADTIPGGGTKMQAAIQAGKLLVELLPPDVNNRVAATRFSTGADTFLPIEFVTAANQQARRDAIADPPLTPDGWTAIAAGAMVGIPELSTPRPGGGSADLTKAMIVLTDGMDNTAYLNPADGRYYSILGVPSRDPANPFNMVNTHPFTPPSDVKIYAIGLGTGQDISIQQLAALSGSAGGYYGSVDPTRPEVAYQLMKFYTQIYMDLVDTATLTDPKDVIHAGDRHVVEFDVLRGDVSGLVVMYDFNGARAPFYLETPSGEIIDAAFTPPGFQLRAGWTDQSRFLDFLLPADDPGRYAGRWKLIVFHDGRVCYGDPRGPDQEPTDWRVKQRPAAIGEHPSETDGVVAPKGVGFLPEKCRDSEAPIPYGFAVGIGSNFRLQAYVTPGCVSVGEPIRLTGVPNEAGLAVTGCTVTVEPTTPDGTVFPTVILRDDGAHDDGDPDDGEYAAAFTHTGTAGSYTFRFRATGYTRDGEPVVREALRSKYVQGYVTNPPGGGPGGRDDECCDRLIEHLERHHEQVRRFLKELGSREEE